MKITDANNISTDFEYDNQNRVTGITKRLEHL